MVPAVDASFFTASTGTGAALIGMLFVAIAGPPTSTSINGVVLG